VIKDHLPNVNQLSHSERLICISHKTADLKSYEANMEAINRGINKSVKIDT